jgi:hypothetical protein
VAGAAVVVFLLAVVAAPFLIPVDRYRPLLTWAIERATGRDVTIDKLQFYLLPTTRIRAINVHMRNPRSFPAGDALVAESVDLGIDLPALLSRRLDITYIAPSGVELNILRNVAGHTNFSIVQSKSTQAQLFTPGFSVDQIGNVAVKNARITLTDLVRGVPTPVLSLNGVSGNVSAIDPHASNWAQKLVIVANLRGAQLTTPLIDRPIDFRSGDLEIKNGEARSSFVLAAADEDLAGSVALAHLDPFSITFDVRGPSLDVAALAAVLRPGSGGVGSTAAHLLARGTIGFDKVTFGSLEATKWRSQLAAYTHALRLDQATFEAYGGAVRGSASLDTANPLPTNVNARIRGMRVADSLAVLRVGGGNVTGLLDADFKLTTQLAHDPEAALAGSGTFSVRNGTFSHLNALAGDSRFSYFGGDVRVANERAYSDRLRLVTSHMKAVSRGSFGFDKSLSYSGVGVIGAASAAAFAPVPAELRLVLANALRQNAGSSRVRARFVLRGTLDNPQFSLAGTPQLLNASSALQALPQTSSQLQDILKQIPGLSLP